MKVKLDENVHGDVAAALRSQGHDVQTVHDEALAGRPDDEVVAAVRAEGRCLVTFDLGFADTRRHRPADFSGLVVLRLRVPTGSRQVDRITSFLEGKPEVAGRLWIVEDGRARDWTP